MSEGILNPQLRTLGARDSAIPNGFVPEMRTMMDFRSGLPDLPRRQTRTLRDGDRFAEELYKVQTVRVDG